MSVLFERGAFDAEVSRWWWVESDEWRRLCRLPIPPPPEPDDDERDQIVAMWRELNRR